MTFNFDNEKYSLCNNNFTITKIKHISCTLVVYIINIIYIVFIFIYNIYKFIVNLFFYLSTKSDYLKNCDCNLFIFRPINMK